MSKRTPAPTTEQMDIEWLTACYTHLIPFNTRDVSGARLAHLIRCNYHTGSAGDGPINETAARIAERLPGTFYRVSEQCGYTTKEPAA